jgi:hypothetical protein
LPDRTAITLPTVSPPHYPFDLIIKAYRTKIKRNQTKIGSFFITFNKDLRNGDKIRAIIPENGSFSGPKAPISPRRRGGRKDSVFPALRRIGTAVFFLFLIKWKKLHKIS